MSRVRVVVAGCTGRMGRVLVRLAAEDAGVELIGAATAPGDPLIGQDAGLVAHGKAAGVAITTDAPQEADVVIEFSTPAGTIAWSSWCSERRVALVSGTTGLEAEHHARLRRTAEVAPVLWAANMSVGVNLLIELAAAAAKALPGWDCEIVEAHHNRKADAPSGTARALLESVCAARGADAARTGVHGRSGVIGPRPPGEIGVHAVRMGGVVGDHDVHFALPGEVVTLRHHAESRDIFAAGALRAAKWIAGRQAGMYRMADVLAPHSS